MPRNIVVCCDGTANEFARNNTNVVKLYSTLERETGLATGWKRCGSLNVAKTPERLTLMKRQMARARGFGIEFEFISPQEAARIAPILRTDDLAGAVWIPGDGKAKEIAEQIGRASCRERVSRNV